MRKAALFLSVALLGFAPLFAATARAADATPAPMTSTAAAFSEAQRAEIEAIIKDYLTEKHPEVMAQGLQNLQKREQDAEAVKGKEAVSSAKERVFNDANSPVAGNVKGNVTVVEFFDYQCGYCKMSQESIARLLKEDKNVKFIFKDFPILGPASAEAAKAALASVKQGKHQAFHDALMGKKDHLSSDMIYSAAKDVGLDVEKLKKDMNEASINDEINANLKLGQDIGVHGTPMFIINDNIFPGALQYDQLKQAVTDARNADKKS
jgi:protein-disulfide isomerase